MNSKLECINEVNSIIELLVNCYKNGGKVLVCGNGGNCADADHIVGELMKSFVLLRNSELINKYPDDDIMQKLQGALPAISLCAHTALITAISNDVSAEMIFAQQVYGYAKPNDVLISLSTSGNSKNVINAAIVAKKIGIDVIAITGKNESFLGDLATINLRIQETETFKVQEELIKIYHYICLELEKYFFGEENENTRS